MRLYERFGGVALLAGLGCYVFAFGLIVLAPALLTDAQEPFVRQYATGERIPVPAYTEAEARGRESYIRHVCWHCHSQFVRPINDEDLRWGPVSQTGESMVDQPHLFGTRRIGPDLAREGGLRPDDWHLAHFYDPRFTVPLSVMPEYRFLFAEAPHAAETRELLALYDVDGDGILSERIDGTAHWKPSPEAVRARLRALDTSGVLAPRKTQGETEADIRAYLAEEHVFTADQKGDGLLSDYDARPRPSDEVVDLVAYIQRLGVAIGPWRHLPPSGTPQRSFAPPMAGVDDIVWAEEIERDEAGNVVLDPETGAPRRVAYTTGIPGGQMPLRSREARLYGAALQAASSEEKQRSGDARREYEALMTAWRQANPVWDQRLAKGEKLYVAYCAGCHGLEGRGNGSAAAWLRIRPRDFTIGAYRYRSTQAGKMPLDGDLYRSIHRGLPGTAMPSWRELSDEQIWLLVDYVKHFAEIRDGVRPPPFNDESQGLAIPPLPPLPVDEDEVEEIFLRGRAVYVAMKCSNCHGTEGLGDGPGWNTTTKDNGGLVRPRDFKPRNDRDQPALRFRGGSTPQDIYRTIFTGLAGTGMPSILQDFESELAAAAALERLEAEGAEGEPLLAARAKARVPLFSPLGEDLPGVVRTEKDGKVIEELDRLRRTELDAVTGRAQWGDEWALVYYVMRLAELDWPLYQEE